MLTNKTEINGKMLSHLYVHNITDVLISMDNKLSHPEFDLYECEYYEIEYGLYKFQLKHKRTDGHTVLVRKAYSEINKWKKRKK